VSAPAAPAGTRSERKHAAIVAAATSVCLDRGYHGASMDEVARVAAVSKQTVYKHFAGKKRLFEEVMLATSEPMHTALREAVHGAAGSGDLEADLRAYGRALLREVLKPAVVRLRHIIVAEADRFPDLAASWHRQGPARTVDDLADRFAALTAAGRLHCPQPRVAAEHFLWLLIAEPLVKSMFVPPPARPARVDARVDAALRVFLAAYGR
jgi:TetR/AcrR family transcriptional regulator, mexJK operon transcriptional repressor